MAPVTADGELDVHISEQNGLGENSMMAFIRCHITSILQPFADRVDEAHTAIATINENILELASNSVKEFGRQTTRMTVLEMDFEKVRKELSEAHSVMSRTTALEAELLKLRADLDHQNEDHGKLRASVFALEHECKGSTHATIRLQSELAMAEQRLGTKTDEAAQRLHADMTSLAEKQRADGQTANSAKALGDAVNANVQQLAMAFEKQARRGDQATAKGGDALSMLEAQMKNAEKRLLVQAEQLKATKSNASALQARVEQLGKNQVVSENLHRSAKGEVTALQQRVIELHSRSGTDSDQGVLELQGSVQRLSNAMSSNEASLQQVQEIARRHGSQLQNVEGRAMALETSQDILKESLQTVDSNLVRRMDVLESLLNSNDQLGRLERERVVSSLSNLQQTVFNKLDVQAQSIDMTSRDLQRTCRDLDSTNARVERLQGELSASVNEVSKLQGTTDLTQEYWKGLTKGFRQTHRSVAVEREMFLPKVGNAPTLPGLSK